LNIKGNVGMSNCKLDHSKEDVKNKFESQRLFLPEEINTRFADFFSGEPTQAELNEMFHLLKKYDLSSEEEQQERNKQILLLLK